MAREDEQQHSVNDISHLFLSNVRSLTGNGMPRPHRKPPGTHSSAGEAPSAACQPASAEQARVQSVDLTPEELAQVFGSNGQRHGLAENHARSSAAATAAPATMTIASNPPALASDVAPVTALLASHLGVRQLERARDYARHLAASGDRVGLIDLDMSEFRLYCFDPVVEPGAESDSRPPSATGMCDPRQIAEAIEELNVDVDRWLLLLPNLRTPEARAMVGHCQDWTLLSTCDHDGIVSAYRTLKGVTEGRTGERICIGLATLDAAGDAEAARVQQKLAAVCLKFLDCDINAEAPVRYAAGVAEHPLMNCRVTRDKAQLASAPHWTVVSQMLSRPRRGAAAPTRTRQVVADMPQAVDGPAAAAPANLPPSTLCREAGAATRDPAVPAEPAIRRIDPPEALAAATADANASDVDSAPAKSKVAVAAAECTPPRLAVGNVAVGGGDDVIDLPGDPKDVTGILAAVLRRPEFGIVECPLAAPACPSARLAVTRDRGLILVAVASHGLSELRSIGKAFQWLQENRSLIAMAMPQFAIDAARLPAILLLVDQSDITGEVLRPMMQAEHVRVRAYRTLRWAGRTGLLLEAA